MFNAGISYNIDDFSPGWDNVSKPTTANKGSARDIKNFNITRHRGIQKRKGITPLFATPAEADKKVTDLYEYNAPDEESYLLTAVDTKLKAFIDGAWAELRAGLTANKRLSFATHLGLCYCSNGVDPNFKLYNNTDYQLGITPPVNAPAVQKIALGSDVKVEEYESSNQDNCGELRQHADRTCIAQGFQLERNAEL